MSAQTTAFMAATVVGLLVAVLLAVGWYLSYAAVRLDRLHTRLEATAAALDVQLARRAQGAADLAYTGELDPASAELVLDAAQEALQHTGPWTAQRAEVETALTEILGVVSVDLADRTRADLEARSVRVRLARGFHNEAVMTTRSVRQRRVVRWLHLAGHTELPQRVEFTDR